VSSVGMYVGGTTILSTCLINFGEPCRVGSIWHEERGVDVLLQIGCQCTKPSFEGDGSDAGGWQDGRRVDLEVSGHVASELGVRRGIEEKWRCHHVSDRTSGVAAEGWKEAPDAGRVPRLGQPDR
jgi:hypothetical protein